MSGPDLSVLTAAIDFGEVVEAVLFVCAALVGVAVVRRAIDMFFEAFGDRLFPYDDREG